MGCLARHCLVMLPSNPFPLYHLFAAHPLVDCAPFLPVFRLPATALVLLARLLRAHCRLASSPRMCPGVLQALPAAGCCGVGCTCIHVPTTSSVGEAWVCYPCFSTGGVRCAHGKMHGALSYDFDPPQTRRSGSSRRKRARAQQHQLTFTAALLATACTRDRCSGTVRLGTGRPLLVLLYLAFALWELCLLSLAICLSGTHIGYINPCVYTFVCDCWFVCLMCCRLRL